MTLKDKNTLKELEALVLELKERVDRLEKKPLTFPNFSKREKKKLETLNAANG